MINALARVILLVLVLTMCIHFAIAGEDPTDAKNRYQWWIERPLEQAQQFQKSVAEPCPTCNITAAGDAPLKPGGICPDSYRRIYQRKVTTDGKPWMSPEDGEAFVNMNIAIGYSDFGDEVVDTYMHAIFVAELRRPCKYVPGVAACGFEQDADDPDVFLKTIHSPEGDVTARVRVTASSATDSEKLNRGEFHDRQIEQTQAAEDTWYGGLSGDAALVIYAGHFRGGGGPSMEPPRVNPATSHTDYDWYRARHTELDRTAQALRTSANPPALVGMFACYTEQYGFETLHKASPATGLILNGNSSLEANLARAYSLLDTTLAMRCRSEAMISLNSVMKYNDPLVTPVTVHGMF